MEELYHLHCLFKSHQKSCMSAFFWVETAADWSQQWVDIPPLDMLIINMTLIHAIPKVLCYFITITLLLNWNFM